MSQPPLLKPLGAVLQKAGLLCGAQIEVALNDQQMYPYLKLGEILSLRGWIKQQTADFFAEAWPEFVKEPNQHQIGHYFQQAALLDETQIKELLFHQKRGATWIRFGALAVFYGYLKQETVDLFVTYLAPPPSSEAFLAGQRKKPHRETDGLEEQDNSDNRELEAKEEEENDIPWIG